MKKLSLTAVLPIIALSLGACGQAVSSAAAQSAGVAGTLEAAALPARAIPPVQAPWSYNIGGSDALNAGSTPSGKVISLDLYVVNTATITRLRNAGKYAVCYYSAGTSETYRSDAESLKLLAPSLNLGQVLRGTGAVWEGEKWLDIRGFSAASTTARIASIRTVMTARLALARSKGCAAVEPDNVDAWDNVVNQGAPAGTPPNAISAADQLAYNRWTAAAAHTQGLSVLLKNDLAQVAALQASYDGALNEECFDFAGDCQLLTPLRDANKAIYVVEYHAASYATAARKTLANQLHLNVTLTDADVTRLNPFGRFGVW